jgi:hypothetical protein
MSDAQLEVAIIVPAIPGAKPASECSLAELQQVRHRAQALLLGGIDGH